MGLGIVAEDVAGSVITFRLLGSAGKRRANRRVVADRVSDVYSWQERTLGPGEDPCAIPALSHGDLRVLRFSDRPTVIYVYVRFSHRERMDPERISSRFFCSERNCPLLSFFFAYEVSGSFLLEIYKYIRVLADTPWPLRTTFASL